MMRTDLGLHLAVSRALRTALDQAGTEITVNANDGVVMLTGSVQTNEEKLTAETVVQRVPGVHAVVQSMTVVARDDRAGENGDVALAHAAIRALSSGMHPIGRDVMIRVEKGWLHLTGTVGSPVEYAAVERALECLDGAHGMSSEVEIIETREPTLATSVAPPAP